MVFRRAKNSRLLLRLRLTSSYRRRFACRLGALTCFLTPSLIARSWRGTGVHPRGDNGLGLFAFGSHPKTNITSRFTRTPCKPAWFPGSLRPCRKPKACSRLESLRASRPLIALPRKAAAVASQRLAQGLSLRLSPLAERRGRHSKNAHSIPVAGRLRSYL